MASAGYSTPGMNGDSNYSNGSACEIRIPKIEEAIALKQTSRIYDQAQEYYEAFEKEKENLFSTYQQCQDKLRSEYAQLRQLLDQREEELVSELENIFNEKDNKIDNQMKAIRNHQTRIDQTENQCKEWIATMEADSERISKIVNICQSVVDNSPSLQQVPINLEFEFKTQKDISKKLTNYGKLLYSDFSSGQVRPFIGQNTKIIVNDIIIGEKPSVQITTSVNNNNNNSNNNNKNKRIDNNKWNVNGQGSSVSARECNSSLNLEDNKQEMKDELEGDIMGKLLSKVKINMDIHANGTLVRENKAISLRYDMQGKKSKNDYKMESLLSPVIATLSQRLKVKKEEIDGSKISFTVLESGGRVENDEDMINYIGLVAIDDKTAIKMKAEYQA